MSNLWHPIPKRHDGGELQLIEAIEALHAEHTGSSDPMTNERYDSIRAYVERRIEHWKPSLFAAWGKYDDAVRDLGCAVLAEKHWRDA